MNNVQEVEPDEVVGTFRLRSKPIHRHSDKVTSHEDGLRMKDFKDLTRSHGNAEGPERLTL